LARKFCANSTLHNHVSLCRIRKTSVIRTPSRHTCRFIFLLSCAVLLLPSRCRCWWYWMVRDSSFGLRSLWLRSQWCRVHPPANRRGGEPERGERVRTSGAGLRGGVAWRGELVRDASLSTGSHGAANSDSQRMVSMRVSVVRIDPVRSPSIPPSIRLRLPVRSS
jgi:hypothetical protein